MAKIDIPKFTNKEELFDFLVQKKSDLIAEKKYNVKEADSVNYILPNTASKAEAPEATNSDAIQVKSIINTTKIMDSHSDVHIDGLWNKSLKENKGFYLLQEHKMNFDKIISDPDQVKASAEGIEWKDLGFSQFKGSTQALVFNSTISKTRNEFMFNQYSKGFVKNHSVGMRYVKLALAMNSEQDTHEAEKAVYDKYIDSIVNKREVEAQGFFWAVTEAKIIEGSAVVKGSNVATPTMSVESKEIEPPKGTQKEEPSSDTLDIYLY